MNPHENYENFLTTTDECQRVNSRKNSESFEVKKESFIDYIEIEKNDREGIKQEKHSFLGENDLNNDSFFDSRSDSLGSPKLNLALNNDLDLTNENDGLWREEGIGWLSKPVDDYGVYCRNSDFDLDSQSEY